MKGKKLIVLDPSHPSKDLISYIEKAVRPGTQVIFITPLTENGFENITETNSCSATTKGNWLRRVKASILLRWQELRGVLFAVVPGFLCVLDYLNDWNVWNAWN